MSEVSLFTARSPFSMNSREEITPTADERRQALASIELRSTRTKAVVQGYLAHKKMPTPRRTPLGPWAQAYGRFLHVGMCVFS